MVRLERTAGLFALSAVAGCIPLLLAMLVVLVATGCSSRRRKLHHLTITTATLPDAYDGQTGYTATLTASGGTGTYTWSIVSGDLPPSLTLDSSTGEITGDVASNASAASPYDFIVEVSDGQQTAQANLSITVYPQLQITTPSLPDGYEGQTGYSVTLTATGGTGTYTWSLTSGTLPANLSWDATTATISGDITTGTAGKYQLDFEVTDGIQTATATLALTVRESLQITTTSLPDAYEGVSYSHTVQATGGNPSNYNWSISGQPSWLAIDAATGELSGTPPAGSAGTYTFTVEVTDGQQTASKSFDLTVKPGIMDWYVDGVNGSDANGGTGWNDAFATIAKALSVAADGDTILVADATYNETNLNFNGKKIHLKGVDYHSGGLTRPVIDCGGAGRAFVFDSGETSDSIVDNFVIKNGSAVDGGAIYCSGSSPTITNCIFSGNEATGSTTSGNGGAIFCTNSSSPTITDCTFSGNSARYGGAVCCYGSSSPTIRNCTFSGNSAYEAGAINCNQSSSPTITDCVFTGNSGEVYGGAVSCWNSSSPSIVNCIFTGNSSTGTYSGFGGAISCYEASLTATNCTFSGNSAKCYGGAIEAERSCTLTFNNCILWGNSVGSGGDGDEIYVIGLCTVTLNYCCVDNSAGAYAAVNSTIDDSNNCIHQDPQFVDAANGDYHLKDTSPCIDAGDNTLVPSGVATDLDGNQRIVDGNKDGTAVVDIGAYEKQ